MQAAADSPALAGVVNLPGFPADADAASAAGSNGFPTGTTTSMSTNVTGDNQFQVSLTTTVDTFFLRVLGFETMDIFSDATAEYIKPVALGSPSNTFGGPSQNFWAAINGRYTEVQQGDPYASLCLEHAASSRAVSAPQIACTELVGLAITKRSRSLPEARASRSRSTTAATT